jgi:hypothetical protein
LQTIRVWCVADADRQGRKPSLRLRFGHAGGAVATDAWWVGENGPMGFHPVGCRDRDVETSEAQRRQLIVLVKTRARPANPLLLNEDSQ